MSAWSTQRFGSYFGSAARALRGASPFVAVLFSTVLLDELIYGVQGTALPLIRDSLRLSYVEVGLLLTVPAYVGLVADPLIGLLGDTRWRRVLVPGGALATLAAMLLVALGQSFALVIVAFCLAYSASTAYVSLSQATLMDLHPERREHVMARWAVLGSLGNIGGPLAISAMLAVGLGWRGAYAGLALMAAAMALALVRGPYEHARRGRPHASIGQLLRELPGLLRNSGVVRWLALGHLADLLLDVLMTFCALYFVDVVGVDPAAAGLAVAVLMLGGLAGDVLLIPLLERLDGVRLLRRTALAALVLYVAFLLVPGYWPKLALLALIGPLRSGWWQVLEARVYAAVPEHSGSVVALGALTGLLPASYPLILGAIAAQFGLAWTMAVLAIGPLSLIVGLPRERRP